MSNLATLLMINLAFISANVVAAGVFLVLADVINRTMPDAHLTVFPWILAGIFAAAAAMIFLVGMLHSSIFIAKRIR